MMGNPAAMISVWKEMGSLMGYYASSAQHTKFGESHLGLDGDVPDMSNEKLFF